jgi:hypothetical protein
MTESAATKSFLDAYRKLRPQAVVTKLAQRFTSHLPDVVIVDGHTYWLEMKMTDNALSAGQQRTLDALDRASRGRAMVVWIDRETRHVVIARPGRPDQSAPSLALGAARLARIVEMDLDITRPTG